MSFTYSLKGKMSLDSLRGGFPAVNSSGNNFMWQLIHTTQLLNKVFIPFLYISIIFSCLFYSLSPPHTPLLANTLKITLWPFCTNLRGFSKSVGWSVMITTLPVIPSNGDGIRWSQVAAKARTFCFQDIGKNLCTAHWWSFLCCWEVFFLLQSSSQFLAPAPLTTPHLSYLPLSPFSLFSSSLAHIQEFVTTIAVNLQSLI